MTGVGIGIGIIGATTLTVVLYMAEHGYAWWQILLMALLGMALMPNYKQRVGDE